jgi:hypothetical protein
MSTRLLHIGFSFPLGEGYQDTLGRLQEIIAANAIDWMRYTSTNYIVWSHLELAHWSNLLRPTPGMESSVMFICAIDPTAPVEGWIQESLWKWVFKYRPHTPAPPPQQPEFPQLFGVQNRPLG